MPATMKLPPFCEPRKPTRDSKVPKPDLRVEPVVPSSQVFSYTYGRLRPRFVTRGAWHELACLLGRNPHDPGTDAFESMLVKLFSPSERGELPSSFYLARELVWPVQDTLGVAQCVVEPASDEEIVELLQNLPTSPSNVPCGVPSPISVVRGVLRGVATGVGAGLDGLPTVGLVSAFPFRFDPRGNSDYAKLFDSYQPLLANNGIGDALRAINLVLTESAAFYELALRLERDARAEQRLVSLHTLPVVASASDRQLEVVFSFQSTTSAVSRWFQRVAVGGPFPFLTPETEKHVLPFYSRPAGAVAPSS